MTPAPPTLDQLALLVAIADEGTFAGAARRLHRVPSAVSYGVKGLEESLGVTLFDRSGHRAAWTDAGQRILEEARGVLARVDHLQRLAASLGDGWEPTLDLVVDGSLPMAPVTAALTRLTAADPPTRVQVHVEYQSGVQARFANSGAALMLPVEIDLDAGLHARPLAPLLMVVVVAPGHALAARGGLPNDGLAAPGGPLDRQDLRAHVELVVKDSAPKYQRAPRESWFGSEHVVHLSDFHSKRLALLEGGGFGWMPHHLVAADLAQGRLVALDLGERGRWTYVPQLVTRRGAVLGRAGRFFVEVLGELFG